MLVASDFYAILGVSRSASPEEIKKAYRKLSKELHPDKNTGNKEAEQKFKAVNEAYETLSDPQKKKMYDQFGSTGGPGGTGTAGFDFSGFQNGADFSGFGDMFESFFGGRAGASRRPREQRGQDMEVVMTISFMEMVTGVTKVIAIDRFRACSECGGSGNEKGSSTVTCDECNGTGQVTKTTQSFFGAIQQSFLCPKCEGRGKVPEKQCADCKGEGRKQVRDQVSVEVPAGIHDGQSLRLRGEGSVGKHGASAGDLYVHIRVQNDRVFHRDEDDVRTDIQLSVIDAILGTQIPVQTVHGGITLKIPAGTQPNQVFRLKGKGLPVLSSSRFGDHYVTVHVEIPSKLSRKERALIEEWKNLR